MNKRIMLFDNSSADSILSQLCLSAWTLGKVVGVQRTTETHKPLRKCSLKGCETLHSHNGGYCCAEHSRKADNVKEVEAKHEGS